MKKLFFTLSALIFVSSAYTQNTTKIHVVSKGETLTQIAKKYHTSTKVLLALNPEAANGINENQKIAIPEPHTAGTTHEVVSKETLYSIAKKYNVSVDQLYALNPDVKNSALQVGQLLVVSKSGTSKKTTSSSAVPKEVKENDPSVKSITVQPGETIYGIAVKNSTTVSQIYELNPEVEKRGIQPGQELKIPTVETPAVARLDGTKVNTSAKTIIVQPKETLYNIAKTYKVTTDQLLEWNPALKEGLKTGMELVVGKPAVKKFELIKDEEIRKSSEDGLKSFKKAKEQRELVLLLPFNMDKVNLNDKVSLSQKLNSDVFLNMTLDFYSGAMIAIDSAKAMNLPLQVKIFDSKESNRSMDVNTLKSQFDFSNTDVVIGPFFQKNVDAISEAFKGSETLIVSPLSTDKGKPYSNQVHTMPNNELLAKAMLGYLKEKGKNTIAVMDPKNKKKALYEEVYPGVKYIETDTKGAVKAEQLVLHLSEEEKNYVILDANSLETAIDLVNALNKLKKKYDIQLVSLDKNENLDSSEINMQDLAQLHLLFPSVTKDSDHWKADKFAEKYREINGSNPNRFAVRGFDVTFDIISRMFTSDNRAQNIFDNGTEQVENKFTYVSENGGIYNNAVYIMYYNDDLTIKEAE